MIPAAAQEMRADALDATKIREALLLSLRPDAEAGPGLPTSIFAAFSPDDWKSFLRALNGSSLSPQFYSKY
jgi:hypothetical protein